MALLATQTIVNAGTAPTFGAAATTDTATYAAGLFVVYKNTNANTRTVTISIPGTDSYGDTFTAHVVNLAANTGEIWIPLRPIARDSTTGLVTFTLAGTSVPTGVTVAIVRLI